MELHQLRYFVAVVDEGSFTRAAERVHVSQSGVSAQVRQLERELGQPLLDRSDRRVTLTDAGAAVLPLARAALGTVEAIHEAAAEVTGLRRGTVHVGMVTGGAMPWFFDALGQVRADHPGITIGLVEGPSDRLQRQVVAGDLHLALVGFAGAPIGGLASHVVVDDRLVAVVPTGHPLAARRTARPVDLADGPLVCLSVGTGIRTAFDAGPTTGPVGLEASSPDTVLGLVARGLGIGILSESMVRGHDDLVAVPLRGGVRSQLGLVWRAAAPPSAATSAVLEAFLGRQA